MLNVDWVLWMPLNDNDETSEITMTTMMTMMIIAARIDNQRKQTRILLTVRHYSIVNTRIAPMKSRRRRRKKATWLLVS